jgi:hypothetical protein
MKVTYLCPHCRGAINAGESIILSGKAGKKNRGLILLHEEIGNYNTRLSSSLILKKGDVADLFCPICHRSLNIRNNDCLAKFIRIEDENKESSIIISRKCGEKITFKIDDNNQIETYGDKLSRFIDPEWYL